MKNDVVAMHTMEAADEQDIAAQNGKKHVLVVDDEQPIVSLLRDVLTDEGYKVDIARDGLSGLNKALEDNYDLVVLDWMLPELEGPEICQRLHNAGITTPVLILTARQQLNDLVEGLDSGADDYIKKPFEVDELLARARALLRRTNRQVESKHLSYGDLTLDTQRHVAQRGDQTLQLTSREFMLLQHLIRYAEQVLTREQIAEAVWGQGLDNLSNVVDLYIHYLRRKVERPGVPRLIRTVRGVGYTLRSTEVRRDN